MMLRCNPPCHPPTPPEDWKKKKTTGKKLKSVFLFREKAHNDIKTHYDITISAAL